MDIEGSEIEALMGASIVMKEYSPHFGIASYHIRDNQKTCYKLESIFKTNGYQSKTFFTPHLTTCGYKKNKYGSVLQKGERKIILSGHFGENNAGDLILLKSLIKGLFSKLTIDKLIIFSANTTNTKLFLEKEKLLRPNIKIYYSGRWGLFEKGKSFPNNLNWILNITKSLKKSTILITGPGNIIKDNTNAFFLIFWLTKVFIAYIFSKKYCFLGIGAIDLRHLYSKIFFNLLKDRCLFFSTRDTKSAAILKKLKVKTDKIFVFSDLSFYVTKKDDLTPIISDKKVIGINLRSFSVKHYSKEVINNYYSAIYKFLCFLSGSNEYKFKFIPFCTESHQNDWYCQVFCVKFLSASF
jgi:hypothetical protein